MTDALPPPRFVPYRPERIPVPEVRARIERDRELAERRRSVRHFSTDPVPRDVIESALRIAGTAPSGAHRQPWHFVAISDDGMKQRIRVEAEQEERAFYDGRAPKEWLDALAPLGTDFVKHHVTDAPWLVVVFRRDGELMADGRRAKNYYVAESVGIAVGFLIAALHRAGLATLPHTPAPMTFLREVCGRPENERPYVMIPVGYPSEACVVPDIARKPLEDIATFF